MRIIFKLLVLLVFAYSCGVKGPPKTPPSETPENVKNINIKQQGNKIVVYWFYNPVYDDGKPIKEKFFFIVEENGNELKDINIRSINNLYWFERSIKNFNNEICYRIIVKTVRDKYSISKYRCIIPQKVDLKPPEYLIKVINEGILINIKRQKKNCIVKIYKGQEKDLIPPIEFASTEEEQFLDRKIKINNIYCYFLTCSNTLVESNPSKISCVIFKDIFPPKPPRNPDYVIYKNSLFLVWTESPSDDVIHYEIMKNNRLIGRSSSYFFQIYKWKKGDTFAIYAVDKAGNRSSPVYLKVE